MRTHRKVFIQILKKAQIVILIQHAVFIDIVEFVGATWLFFVLSLLKQNSKIIPKILKGGGKTGKL